MLIRRLKVSGLLSFGPQGIDLPLHGLNVLIGPNGSGKSNLLEVLSLLRASPRNLPEPVKEMGGVTEWLWKGPGSGREASIDAVIDYPQGAFRCATCYKSPSMVSASRSRTSGSKTRNRTLERTMSISTTDSSGGILS